MLWYAAFMLSLLWDHDPYEGILWTITHRFLAENDRMTSDWPSEVHRGKLGTWLNGWRLHSLKSNTHISLCWGNIPKIRVSYFIVAALMYFWLNPKIAWWWFAPDVPFKINDWRSKLPGKLGMRRDWLVNWCLILGKQSCHRTFLNKIHRTFSEYW